MNSKYYGFFNRVNSSNIAEICDIYGNINGNNIVPSSQAKSPTLQFLSSSDSISTIPVIKAL